MATRPPSTTRRRASDPTARLTHSPFADLAHKGIVAAPSEPTAKAATGQPPSKPRTSASGKVTLRLETKGRGGKAITRMMGLPSANIEAIAGRIRKALGCDVSQDGDELILGGSLLTRASAWLESAGDLRTITDESPTRPLRPLLPEPPSPSGSMVPSPHASGTRRADVRPGLHVAIVLKADQQTGKLTQGIVRDLLTSSPVHPRGIKVRLASGEVGRVKIIYEP